MNDHDPETGEVSRAMPAAIAEAVVAVCKQVKTLGTDSQNEHAKYAYVSIDKFIAILGPMMAEAGLILTQDEVSAEIRAGEGGKGWLFARYAFGLAHTSGVTWGPVYRSVALQAHGPQSFGSAESYMMKRFMRGLFMVPTGEKDADEEAAAELPAGRASRSGNGAQRQQAAAAPTDNSQDRWKELRDLIDGSNTVPDIDAVYACPAWASLEALLAKVRPEHVAKGAMQQLKDRGEARKRLLLGAQEQMPEEAQYTA